MSAAADLGRDTRPVAVFDIDGVLADVSHRLHYLQSYPQRWDRFFAAADRDPLLAEGAARLRAALVDHDVPKNGRRSEPAGPRLLRRAACDGPNHARGRGYGRRADEAGGAARAARSAPSLVLDENPRCRAGRDGWRSSGHLARILDAAGGPRTPGPHLGPPRPSRASQTRGGLAQCGRCATTTPGLRGRARVRCWQASLGAGHRDVEAAGFRAGSAPGRRSRPRRTRGPWPTRGGRCAGSRSGRPDRRRSRQRPLAQLPTSARRPCDPPRRAVRGTVRCRVLAVARTDSGGSGPARTRPAPRRPAS